MSLADKLKVQAGNKQDQGNVPVDPKPEPQRIEEEKTFAYATPHSDGFTFHFEDGTTVKTKDGVMVLNQTQHDEIQALLKKGRPDIAQHMVLTDPLAAEKIARAYLEDQARKRQAHQGASSTAMQQRLTQEVGAEKPRNLDVVESDISHGNDGSLNDNSQK